MTNINIKDFCNKVISLNTEENKLDFIKNYSDYKNTFNNIDKILNEKKVYDYENKTISELFDLLEIYEKKIQTETDIDVVDFKYLVDLTNYLEKRINDEKLNIEEVK